SNLRRAVGWHLDFTPTRQGCHVAGSAFDRPIAAPPRRNRLLLAIFGVSVTHRNARRPDDAQSPHLAIAPANACPSTGGRLSRQAGPANADALDNDAPPWWFPATAASLRIGPVPPQSSPNTLLR